MKRAIFITAFFAVFSIFYFLILFFNKNYVYRESRTDVNVQVSFDYFEHCEEYSLSNGFSLIADGFLNFGTYERRFNKKCRFFKSGNETVVLFGVTENGIVAYLNFDKQGDGDFTLFSKLNKYNYGPFFRYGHDVSISNQFSVDTSVVDTLAIYANVVHENIVTSQEDLFFNNPIDTTTTTISGCVYCVEIEGLIDTIINLEKVYLGDHHKVIANPKNRLAVIKNKLDYKE